MKKPECERHPGTKLICPRCIAARGGRARAKKHARHKLSTWGKAGGRPRKKKAVRRKK